MRLIASVIVLQFIIFPASLWAEDLISLTLDQAVGVALRDNRDILLKEQDLKKAKAKLSEANASLFPALNFTATRKIVRGLYAKDLPETNTQTTLKQYLYRGGETINTIKFNQYGVVIAQAQLDKAKLDTVLNVNKAFSTLLLASDFAKLNKAILENTKAHIEYLKAKYKEGQASHSELLKIEQSLMGVKKAYESSLSQVDSGETLLKNLLYLDEKVRIEAQGEFNYEELEIAYDEAFLMSMKNRPEIRQYEAQKEAAKRSIEIAKSDTRPSIYASWDYYSSSVSVLTFSPVKAWQDYNVVGLTFSWPIFDGWATKAKVDQAIADLKSAQLLKEKTVKDITLELRNAYLDLKNAIASIKSAESEVMVYKDSLSVIEKQSSKAIASFLDLDDADLRYNVSLFNKKQAIYDYVIAKARFEKATGGI